MMTPLPSLAATLSPSPLPPRPKHAGLVNLGNTCYLNAVLQALLSVPAFATDLRSSALDALAIPDGVVTALSALDRQRQRAAAAAGAPGVAVQGPLSPLPVKESVASRLDRFHGTLQHDAHEFLVSLVILRRRCPWQRPRASLARSDSAFPLARSPVLPPVLDLVPPLRPAQMDIAQQEVLSAEARRWRRKGVPVTATACPVSRTFSMCLEHAFSCPRCGARSHVSETTTVLR